MVLFKLSYFNWIKNTLIIRQLHELSWFEAFKNKVVDRFTMEMKYAVSEQMVVSILYGPIYGRRWPFGHKSKKADFDLPQPSEQYSDRFSRCETIVKKSIFIRWSPSTNIQQ